MSTPFRDGAPALEERLRRAEETLAELEGRADDLERARTRRRRARALVTTALVATTAPLGFFAGAAFAYGSAQRGVHEAERIAALRRVQDDAELRRCGLDLHREQTNVHGCLHVTERALEARVELHVAGEPLSSPVRSRLAAVDIGQCGAPTFQASITFDPSGSPRVVELIGEPRRSLSTAERLCLDQSLRAVSLPPWSGPPMVVLAKWKVER